MSRPVHGGNLAWAARLARCAPAELLDFSASISPLGPPCSVSEAIRAAFSSVVAYPDPDYGELREAIAHHHQLSPDWVLPGNGAAELLTWAARDLAELPGGCLRLTPTFSDYDRALRAFGCEPIDLPLLDSLDPQQGWNFDSWEKSLLQTDLNRYGLLLNNPHNPTGALFAKSRLRPLLPKFGLVVVDEAFMDFLPPARSQSVIDWVSELPNLVVIRSLTKFYSMPGVRLGYVIARPETLQRWQTWRDPWAVNVLAAAAGVAAIQDTDFQQRTWDWLTAANTQLYEGLTQLPGLSPLPGCVNFLLVACEGSATALQTELLQRHQIYIRDCMSFAELGDRYFRIAVKTTDDNQRLLDALANVLPDLEVAHAY
ncbi:threonine-phosphate decarboxylase CobD [Leptolyngbya sp. BC1307]|uniref:threonine-phosphate decarboxylase CobD n=1 Tax=Leptolyngbya sp. BC1307 TaxID=2029589 RepID=UPI000EFDA3D4|nr:threonine-phosphate decarboxylase CobD [Leptolyngbya sp. BC1307]